MTVQSSARIFRYEIPVDDQWHAVPQSSMPLYVSCRDPRVVEFWAWHRPEIHDVPGLTDREYRVYGTGHPVDEEVWYAGTAIAPGGSLVWHLMTRS